MIDMILLGIKDLFHNIRVFILLIISIFIVTIIFTSSTLSLSYSSKGNEHYLSNEYVLVPTSTDMADNKMLLTRYTNFLEDNGMSYFLSDELYDVYGMPVYVIMGDPGLFNEKLKDVYHTKMYVVNNTSDGAITFTEGATYPTSEINLLNTNFPDAVAHLSVENDPFMLLILKDEDITEWLRYQDGGLLLSFIQDTIFENASIKYEQALNEILENSFITIRPLTDTTDDSFIFKYIYPYILIVIVCILISFWIFYSYFLKKMYREYIIHILYGAKKSDIFIRNSVLMLISWIVLLILFTLIKQGERSSLVNIGYVFITILLAFLEIITIYKINCTDKLKDVKGVSK